MAALDTKILILDDLERLHKKEIRELKKQHRLTVIYMLALFFLVSSAYQLIMAVSNGM